VHALGARKDAAAIAAAFDVAVLPATKREGLPKTVIESMAQGVATIASRVGGVPELIEQGVSGLIVPPGDVGALEQAILRLYRDAELRTRLGADGRSRIATAFRVDETVRLTAALYDSLVAENADAVH
jgi:glycosyltransferase involved in cell wall biosynthesis